MSSGEWWKDLSLLPQLMTPPLTSFDFLLSCRRVTQTTQCRVGSECRPTSEGNAGVGSPFKSLLFQNPPRLHTCHACLRVGVMPGPLLERRGEGGELVEGECSRATTPDSGGTGGYFTLSESDASEGGKEGEMETTRVSYR